MVLQTIFVSIAGFLLWRLWRLTDREHPIINWTIAGGLLVRGLGGAVLFWISYLRLPFGRSLQLGDGFWFVGLDGVSYLKLAREGAAGGLSAIAEISATFPSVVYVRVLALFVWLFGSASAVAILLNLFAYLGSMLLILRWAKRREVSRRAAMVPIAVISFLPSWLVWSVQPLKDAFFCFFVVAFAFAVDKVVHEFSPRGEQRAAHVVGGALLMLISMYALAGVRWYYALAVLGVAVVAFAVALFVQRSRRQLLTYAVVAALAVLLSTQLLVAGAGPYLPEKLRHLFHPFGEDAASADVRHVVELLEGARENLDAYEDAGTRIRIGESLEQLEPGSVAASASAEPQPPANSGGPNSVAAHVEQAPGSAAKVVKVEAPQTAAVSSSENSAFEAESSQTYPPDAPESLAAATPSSSPAADRDPQHHPGDVARTNAGQSGSPLPPPPARSNESPTAAIASPSTAAPERNAADAQSDGAPPSSSAATRKEAAGRSTDRHQSSESLPTRTTGARAEPIGAAPGASSEAIAAVNSSPSIDQEGAGAFESTTDVPTTIAGRIVTGLAAMFLPPTVAMSTGLISMTGGRGLWLFADIDTILFDALLIVAIIAIVRSIRAGGWRDPLLWYLILTTTALAGALAYAISNYGTLFRHREMVVATLCLITLAGNRFRRPIREESRATAASEIAPAASEHTPAV